MKNVVKIPTNEILENASFITSQNPMKERVKNSILYDYSDGIRQAVVSVIPNDYYLLLSQTGKKQWSSGQIIEIGDQVAFTIKPTSENRWIPYKFYKQSSPSSVKTVWFEVVDRKVRYEGQIIIDLVLQESKEID